MGNWQKRGKKKKGASGGERANVSEKVKKQCEFGFKISIFCAKTKESCGDMLRKLIRISLRRNCQSQNDIAEWIPPLPTLFFTRRSGRPADTLRDR